MNKILIVLALIISASTFAQEPRVQEVGSFDEIKVFDRMKVNLIKSNEEKVVLSGRDINDIEVDNDDGVLKVRMELDKAFNGDETFVEVHYTSLNVIDGNEGAEIVTNELIEQDYIEVRMQEGAKINAGFDVRKIDMRAVTGGIINASGQASDQHIELNTGGVFKGKELKTETTSIRIQAGGEADINASQLADIKLRAGGNVYVYGKPLEVRQNKFIGGTVKVM